MENEISNEYIENAINELEKFFGIKEPVLNTRIFSLIKNNKIKDAMKLIARQLGLPIDINITNVPDNYGAQNDDNRFHSTYLTKTHKYGSGNEGITAQVTIPENLPFYGSSTLNEYPINVKISKSCTKHPATFTMIMAHELSHILLYSLNHSEKKNEFYTDLVVIMLGFKNIFKSGRKISKTSLDPSLTGITTSTQTTTYGYLSDKQFNFAYNKINSILEKNRKAKILLTKEFIKFTKLLSEYEKKQFKFKDFLEYLTKNTNKKISGKDGKKIMTFFQPGYMDELNLLSKKFKEKQEIIKKLIEGLSHYTDQKLNQLSIYTDDLKSNINELLAKLILLKNDVHMLKKYIDYRHRIELFFFLYKK